MKKSRNKVVTIISVIICVILIPILIANLTILVKSFTRPDEVPSFLGYKPLIVLSGSMEPEFYSGDLVLVREVEANTVKQGDIIAYREGESVITHRVIEITTKDGRLYYTTKGDNNNVEDKIPVTEDKLEGKYLFKISGLGNTAMFMQTPLGMLVFIVLPLSSFILYDIFRRRYYERREKARTKELEEELARARQQVESINKSD